MKKTLFLLAVVSLLGSSLIADDAEAPKKNPSFLEVRNAALSKEKLESTKTARVIYSVTGNHESAFIMIRAKRHDKFRMDCINGKECYSFVRNGDSFWMYDPKDGKAAMDEDEAASFAEHIAFMAVPFSSKQILSNPVYKGGEEVNNVKRSRYEVTTLNESGNVYQMYLEDKSKLLRKIEKTDSEGKTTVKMFRDYRDYHGIKLPKAITLSGVMGSYILKIVKADWNLDIDDKIFEKDAKVVDAELDQILKSPISEKAKQDNAKKKQDQRKIEQLEKKIRKLKLEIADSEKTLQNLENVSKSDRASAQSLASITSHSDNSYWGWGYSGHSRDRAANRDATTRKKVVAQREKEAKQVTEEYKKVNKKLLQQRIELGDAEAELKKLTGEEDD